MNKLTPIIVALKALKRNQARTILTVIGIIIGIAAVITIFSVGKTIKDYILSEIESFGSNIIEVEIKIPGTVQTSTENAMGMAMGAAVTTLKESDREEIAKLENIKQSYGGNLGQALVSYQSNHKTSLLMGVSDEFIDIDQSEIDQGRFFTEQENNSASNVVILGAKVIETLFGNKNPLNKTIKIKKNRYQVIGTLKERGGAMFFDMDNVILMPIKTLQKKITGTDYITFIMTTMKDPGQQELTKLQIEDILRERHDINDPKDDDFAVVTMEEMQDILTDILGGISLLLTAIAFISLIVGGVGIMNIMYVSVYERTYEIGLRKTVGATNKSIFFQFLWESLFITLSGGLLGMILGMILSLLIVILANHLGFEWTFSIMWKGVAIAILFSTAVGFIFGLYPAIRASQLDPIKAIRKE